MSLLPLLAIWRNTSTIINNKFIFQHTRQKCSPHRKIKMESKLKWICASTMLNQYLALIDLLSKGSVAIQQSYYFYQMTKCYLCIFTDKAKNKFTKEKGQKQLSKLLILTRNNFSIRNVITYYPTLLFFLNQKHFPGFLFVHFKGQFAF